MAGVHFEHVSIPSRVSMLPDLTGHPLVIAGMIAAQPESLARRLDADAIELVPETAADVLSGWEQGRRCVVWCWACSPSNLWDQVINAAALGIRQSPARVRDRLSAIRPRGAFVDSGMFGDGGIDLDFM